MRIARGLIVGSLLFAGACSSSSKTTAAPVATTAAAASSTSPTTVAVTPVPTTAAPTTGAPTTVASTTTPAPATSAAPTSAAATTAPATTQPAAPPTTVPKATTVPAPLGPKVTNFSVTQPASCASTDVSVKLGPSTVTVSWKATAAEKVYVAIDNPDGPFESNLTLVGSLEVPFACPGPHTYYVVAETGATRDVKSKQVG